MKPNLLIHGIKGGFFLTAAALFGTTTFALTVGECVQGFWATFWEVYLGLMIFLPAALFLRAFNWLEAFGNEGFQALAEDLTRGKANASERLQKGLVTAKSLAYRLSALALLFWSAMAGAYAGMGAKAASFSPAISLVLAALPALAVLVALWVYRAYRSLDLCFPLYLE